MPGAHADSAFSERQGNRMDGPPPNSSRNPYLAAGATASLGSGVAADPGLPPRYTQAAIPPQMEGYWTPETDYYDQQGDIITPGANNFSRAAAGGVAGVAYNVVESDPRESRLEAIRGTNYPQQVFQTQQTYGRDNGGYGTQTPTEYLRPGPKAYTGDVGVSRDSHSSLQGLNAAAVPMGEARSPGYGAGPYIDDPYMGYSGHSLQNLGVVHPDDIYDDGDDGLEYTWKGPRNSIMGIGGQSSRSGHNGATAATGGAAAGAGVIGALGGLVSRNAGNQDGSGLYNAVQTGANTGHQGVGANPIDLGTEGEKSAWLAKQGATSKRWKWVVMAAVALIIAAAIACGVYFGAFYHKDNHSGGVSRGGSGQSASDDSAHNGDLSLQSPEIQKLLNNTNLHKVFPGIDYTPINTQYPDCLANPASQNNVTRDVAVLSQLTNTLRLYGTDCNQTELLIHAINQLEMNDTIKIWMGVWQDGNATTNARQLSQMWDILDNYGDSPFKGVIVANEILYRKEMTATKLGDLLSEVRTNITNKGMSLPVATSDLGDDWTSELAEMSDYIMSNIHPFFGGVNAMDAAAWTYSFWENNNGEYFKSDSSKNIIAETGWPSQGGTDCGTTKITDCPDASVAGIDGMNQFMSDWVCQALENGTQYFWFESFDEPWKISYDSGDENWEDHWGIMDVNRKLKDGVTIPDCGGKTVD